MSSLPSSVDVAIIGAGAAGLGVLEVLEEQRAGALAEDEAIARLVEGSRHGLRRLAGTRHAHPAHVRETGVGHLEER